MMLDILKSIIFGVVQGVAEFLPISSSGHLVILHRIISLPVNNDLAFDVALHLATLLAVGYYFRRDIFELAVAWFKSLGGKSSELSRLAWLIVLATIPAAIAGELLDSWIETKFRSTLLVALMLALVGGLLLVAERVKRPRIKGLNINRSQALAIGAAQALALVPGTSRSGITIIAGLFLGLERQMAVKFSFLLSIPIILGAALTKLPSLLSVSAGSGESLILGASFISAAVSGFFAIKYLMAWSSHRGLEIFAYYRFALAVVLIVYLLIA